MSFSIGSLRCIGHPERSRVSHVDVALLLTDGSLFVLTAAASGVALALIFSGILTSGWTSILAFSGIGGSIGLMLLDGGVLAARVAHLSRLRAKGEISERGLRYGPGLLADMKKEETISRSPFASKEEIRAHIIKGINTEIKAEDSTHLYHKLLDHLYLGHYLPVLDCLINGKTQKGYQDGNPIEAMGFSTIITCNPLFEIYLVFSRRFPEKTSEEIHETFIALAKGRRIQWKYVGENFKDSGNDEDWNSLIHNCTFSEEERLVFDDSVSTDRFTEELSKHQAEVGQLVDRKKIIEWFEPTFKLLDEAVLEGKKEVYIHCYGGQSRSVALFAAYLINRFNVTTDEALGFIASKRPIDCKFIKQLKKYEEDLKAVRESEEKKKKIKADILASIKEGADIEDKDAEYHKILGQIYLGSASPITGAIFGNGKALKGFDERGKPIEGESFTRIVTCSPLGDLCDKFSELSDGNNPFLPKELEEIIIGSQNAKGYEWEYLGTEVGANPERAWIALVQNGTFPKEEWIKSRYSEKEYNPNFEKEAQQRKEKVEEKNVSEWFEPVFEMLDKAVLDEEGAIFIHCVDGRSKSVALFAAYLINRFDLSAKQALDFIAVKRTIDRQFEGELTRYATDLREHRESLFL